MLSNRCSTARVALSSCGRGVGLVRACEPRLLIPVRGGRCSESPAWEALNPSVLLKRKHGKRLSWESSSGRGKNCSIPLKKLCVKSRGRAAACVNCCGYAEINGVLAADVSSGMAPGEKFRLMQPGSQKHVYHLSAWPDLPLSFLPTLDLCRCRVLLRAVPRTTNLGCLRGARALTRHVRWKK